MHLNVLRIRSGINFPPFLPSHSYTLLQLQSSSFIITFCSKTCTIWHEMKISMDLSCFAYSITWISDLLKNIDNAIFISFLQPIDNDIKFFSVRTEKWAKNGVKFKQKFKLRFFRASFEKNKMGNEAEKMTKKKSYQRKTKNSIKLREK